MLSFPKPDVRMLRINTHRLLCVFFFGGGGGWIETTTPDEMQDEATTDLSCDLNHFYITWLFIMVNKTKRQFIASPCWCSISPSLRLMRVKAALCVSVYDSGKHWCSLKPQMRMENINSATWHWTADWFHHSGSLPSNGCFCALGTHTYIHMPNYNYLVRLRITRIGPDFSKLAIQAKTWECFWKTKFHWLCADKLNSNHSGNGTLKDDNLLLFSVRKKTKWFEAWTWELLQVHDS